MEAIGLLPVGIYEWVFYLCMGVYAGILQVRWWGRANINNKEQQQQLEEGSTRTSAVWHDSVEIAAKTEHTRRYILPNSKWDKTRTGTEVFLTRPIEFIYSKMLKNSTKPIMCRASRRRIPESKGTDPTRTLGQYLSDPIPPIHSRRRGSSTFK